MQARLLLAVLLLVSLACTGQRSPASAGPTAPPAATQAPGAAPFGQPPAPLGASATPTSAASVVNITGWLTYQHDLARSGETGGAYNPTGIKQLWESDRLDGLVYGQVLANAGRAFAVTQNNTVYSLDAATGRTMWSQHLGDPVPRNVLPCGNVDVTGILSTPVIDASAGLLYAVDYLNDPTSKHHELVGLDLNDGGVRFQNPIDPPDANPLPLQQRGALTLAKGTVYVAFGGLFGDCGDYHGYVVSAGAPDGHRRGVFKVPTNRQGGIWTAPAVNATGDLYVTTGNGDSTTNFDQSNSVIRLSSDLKLLDFFAPTNWADLSRRDADLGSTGPILLDNGRILQVGKSGVGYLLNASGLGRIGGELFQAPICSSGAYGGGAHSGNMAYVPCNDGLVAVQMMDTSFSIAWRGPQFPAGAPVLTDDAVWTLNDSTTSLYALSRRDGSVLFREPAGQAANPPHFLAPSAADGRIFHPAGNVIVAFGN